MEFFSHFTRFRPHYILKIHLSTDRNRNNNTKLGKLIFCVRSDKFFLKHLQIPYELYKVSLRKPPLKTVLGWMEEGNIVQTIQWKREKKKYLCWDAILGYFSQDIPFSQAQNVMWVTTFEVLSHQLRALPLVLCELGSSCHFIIQCGGLHDYWLWPL